MSILPPFTPTYPFKGFQDCLRIIQQATDQYKEQSSKTSNAYIGFNINNPSFLTYFRNGEENMLRLSWEIYDHTHYLLRMKIPSFEHEATKCTFGEIFSDWYRSHSKDRLIRTDGESVRGQDQTKQADLAWRPGYPPNGRSYKWPTMVVEVAWSERRPKIEKDVKFWLANSNGQVMAALTITVTRSKITIESWELKSRNDRMVPRPTQKIEIARKAAPKCPRIRGHLGILFEDVFLQEKPKGVTDFVLNDENMEEMARKVWKL